MAPARTPRPVVEKPYREIAAIVRIPEVRRTLVAQDNDPVGGTPDDFAALVKTDAEKWGAIGKRLGVAMD